MATSRSTPPSRPSDAVFASPSGADVIRPEFHEPVSGRTGPPGPEHRWTLWDALKAHSLRNLVFALVLAALGGAGGGVIALRQTPLYSSSAALLIDQPALISNAKDEGLLRKLSLLRLKYAALVRTPGMAGIVAQQLGVPEGQVAAAVSASAPPDSLVLVTTAQSRTPSTAVEFANGIADAVVQYTNDEQVHYAVPLDNRYQFTVVSPASEAAKIQPRRMRAVQAAFGLGAVLFAIAYVILQLLTSEYRLT
jgi:capsular polysaccharide biosynthesis protein